MSAVRRAVRTGVEGLSGPLEEGQPADVVPFPQRIAGEIVQLRVDSVSGEEVRLVGGASARRALSCLAEPRAGDEVLVWRANQEELFVTAVLTRRGDEKVTVAPPGERELQISARRLSLAAQEDLTVVSGRDCIVSAPRGNVALSARNILQSTTQALLQHVGEWLLCARDVSVKSEETVQIHAKRQLITSDKELKMDGEIIHMG
jgi:Protein of unknown function (DUF3540)